MLRIVAAALVIAFWTASSIPIVDDPTNSTSLYTCSLIRFLLSATNRQARDQGHARFDRRSSDERCRDGGSIVHPLAQSGESVGSDHGLRANGCRWRSLTRCSGYLGFAQCHRQQSLPNLVQQLMMIEIRIEVARGGEG